MVERKAGSAVSIGDVSVAPGRKESLELPVSRLPTGSTLSVPVTVINGRRAGPRVWVSAAVHGDEMNGVDIVRRLVDGLNPRTMNGAVLAVPVVNVFGFIQGSRYLPDRRDLNRSFPGSARGSTASRLAHLFMTSIVDGCDVGIDLHTGSNHRDNHPQVRANLDDRETAELAARFGAPFMVHSRLRDGSLREAAVNLGVRMLVYEAGEPLRFDATAIATGLSGIRRVLSHLGMIEPNNAQPVPDSVEIRSSSWVRARRSGMVRLRCRPGEHIEEGAPLGEIFDAVGGRPARLYAPLGGWVLGVSRNPMANRGDGLVHIGVEAS